MISCSCLCLTSALSAQVNELNLNFDKWKDVLHNTNTATNMDFKPMNTALTRELKNAQLSLDDLRGTVVMVENRRADFPHIDEV